MFRRFRPVALRSKKNFVLKLRYLSILILLSATVAQAQPPAGYYNSAAGKKGEALRIALYNIIKGHTELTYTPGLWIAYNTTDNKGNGKLASIYSDKPGATPPYEFTLGSDQCGSSTPSTEGGCYNREHIWPQSKFGKATPMLTDLWIAYPTDSKVNSQRADWPYGIVLSPTWTSQNGSKLGPNKYTGAPATTAFEPIDSFKGDIARSYFYITTRYWADSAQFQDWEMATKVTLKPWAIKMLLNWHHLDPVSAKEVKRNNAAYALQDNRNPFIDNPAYADSIWSAIGGTTPGVGVEAYRYVTLRVAPNPAVNNIIIDWLALSPDEVLAVDVLNIQGQTLYHATQPKPGIGLNVADWPNGLYLLQVRTQHGVMAEKLIVE